MLQGLVYNENARNQAIQSLQQNLNQNAQDFLEVLNNIPLYGDENVTQGDNVRRATQALRQLLPEGNPRREMATQGEMNRWITDEDLQMFSNALDINIVLISEQNGNRIFMPREENNPAQQQTLDGVLHFARDSNVVILYHNLNHYQTVINA